MHVSLIAANTVTGRRRFYAFTCAKNNSSVWTQLYFWYISLVPDTVSYLSV